MSFYLVTISPEQIFIPDVVKNAVINDPSIDAWWNHISNTYIIRTSQKAQYHANRILNTLPGLSFLIVRVDLNEYNGYLPQIAWDWIRAHSSPKPTYKSLPPSQLLKTMQSNTIPIPQSSDLSKSLSNAIELLKRSKK